MQNKIYTYISNHKIINLLNLMMLIILLVPYSCIYGNTYETEELHWMPIYIYDDKITFIPFILFLVFIIGFQLLKKGKLKNLFLKALVVHSLLCFLYGMLVFIMPMQDFMPHLGYLLILAIFPLSILLFRIEK